MVNKWLVFHEDLELYQKGFGEPVRGNYRIRLIFSEIFLGSSGG